MHLLHRRPQPPNRHQIHRRDGLLGRHDGYDVVAVESERIARIHKEVAAELGADSDVVSLEPERAEYVVATVIMGGRGESPEIG